MSVANYSATFAFKRARRALSMFATYKPEGSRSALLRNKEFAAEFERQVACVRTMQVYFIELSDPVAQYLLELYAHMEWKLPLDEFDIMLLAI